MEEIRSIVARFPQRELEIRRRCVCDPRFRSICVDHQEAATALRYWQKVADEGARKKESGRMVEEYVQFLGELESEILTQLESTGAKARGR